MTSKLGRCLEQRFGVRIDIPDTVAQEPELLAIAEHRSCRRYLDKPVTAPLLQTLLACALSAPSKSDLQQLSVLVVNDGAKRAVVQELLKNMPWIACAPVLLIFCADNRRLRRICELRGRPYANDHLDSFFNPAVDAALAMMNFIRAAEAVGLGCCPLSAVRNHAAPLATLFELPGHVYPVAGLVSGYPADAGRLSPRLPMSMTVHYDRYSDDGFEADLDSYDRRRHTLTPLPQDRQREHQRFGMSHFYGWSEDKARQVSTPERADFGDYIKKQGFKLV